MKRVISRLTTFFLLNGTLGYAISADFILDSALINRLPVENQMVMRQVRAFREAGKTTGLEGLFRSVNDKDSNAVRSVTNGFRPVLDLDRAKLKSGGYLLSFDVPVGKEPIESSYGEPLPGDLITLRSGAATYLMVFVGNGGFPTWNGGETSYFYQTYSTAVQSSVFGYEINSFPPRLTPRLLEKLNRNDTSEIAGNSKLFGTSNPNFTKSNLSGSLRTETYEGFYLNSKIWNKNVDMEVFRVVVPADVKSTLDKIRRLRLAARGIGATSAIKALDHYLSGSGRFVAIDDSKTQGFRKQVEDAHKADVIKTLFTMAYAAELQVALDILTGPGDIRYSEPGNPFSEPIKTGFRAKPVNEWPSSHTFKLSFANDGKINKSEGFNDMLEYAGEVINSELTITAVRIEGTRRYKLRIDKWESWVVDNYDWEGDKALGIGGNLLWRDGIQFPFVPTQKEMNNLQKKGYAKAYQRSGKSWQVEGGGTYEAQFDTDSKVEDGAALRRQKIDQNEFKRTKEKQEGALEMPRPSNEMNGKKEFTPSDDIKFWRGS